MSLKAFHVFFIAVSILLAFGFGCWEGYHYFHEGAGTDLALSVLSLAGGVALIFYFRAVLKKLRNVSYL